MTMQEISQICKVKRNNLGMTQQQLADILGLSKPRISEFEHNKSNLQFDTLKRICDVLQLKIEVINII
jgi:transcriptional regulator with XRE-family HTH domain